jgi:hypothetical protein
MQKRCKVYLRQRKKYEVMLKELTSLYMGVAIQAQFPDSGYYYKNKEMACRNKERDCKAIVPKKMFKAWQQMIMPRIQKAQYEYYEKPQVKGRNGHWYTAYEMDAAMVNH